MSFSYSSPAGETSAGETPADETSAGETSAGTTTQGDEVWGRGTEEGDRWDDRSPSKRDSRTSDPGTDGRTGDVRLSRTVWTTSRGCTTEHSWVPTRAPSSRPPNPILTVPPTSHDLREPTLFTLPPTPTRTGDPTSYPSAPRVPALPGRKTGCHWLDL